MTKGLGAVAAVIALVATLLVMRSGSADGRYYEPVEVRRGEVSHFLRETGTVTPREPVLVKTSLDGVLEWVIEDEKWVEAGDRLVVVNDEISLKEVSRYRTDMLTARQELALALLNREHAARLEDQKVRAAEREYELATTRYRILSSAPQGGRRLIEIHDQLLPLEKEGRQLRMDYERAQDSYQETQDAYLDRLDAWQEQQDAIVNTQAQIDRLLIRAEAFIDESSIELEKDRDEAVGRLEEARRELEALRAKLPELANARDEAATRRDEAMIPRDALYIRLAQREKDEKELYIQLEIEKRGVALAKLQLDQQIAELTLEEAERKYREGEATFANGAISADQLEKLKAEVITATRKLEVLEQQIAIASRPAPEEELEEARLRMEQAELKARTAGQARDRNLKALDQKIVRREATLDLARFQVERADKQFPSVIESSIEFLKHELEGLEETQSDRREEILKELEELKPKLERAKANPPNIVNAPVSGIARLSLRWGGVIYAGLNVNGESVVARIYPPGNLEIQSAINEANVRSVRKKMPVRITVPALAGRELSGVISLVTGIGKDKWQEFVNNERPVFAGVTQFETRVQIDAVPDDLRPGMTVILEIKVDGLEDVLHLPRGAVRENDSGYEVLTGSRRSPRSREIQGNYFGDDLFIVASGLKEGDRVYVERQRSR